MDRILLLRGINLGASKRVSMPALRELLEANGLSDVRTYVQSGNVVVAGDAAPDRLARRCSRLIADELGLEVDVVARTRDELAQVVERDPLGEVATDAKRYLVTFLSAELDPDVLAQLRDLAAGGERVEAIGREVYTWRPDGAARSKLSGRLAGADLGVVATSRNWNTVRKLLEMAS